MKNNRLVITIATLIITGVQSLPGNAQVQTLSSPPPVITFQREYVNTPTELVYGMEQTPDSGFIMIGQAYSFSAPTFNDFYLQKTDKYGNTTWAKHLGVTGLFNIDRGASVRLTSDGGYIAAGGLAGGGGNMGLVKTDASGNFLWAQSYGDFFVANSVEGEIQRVVQTTDGGYIMASYTDSIGSSNDADIAIIKTDAIGNVDWTRFYDSFADASESAAWIAPTNDAGYIVAGSTNVNGNMDVVLIKTDINGDSLWTKIYDLGWDESTRYIEQTQDGGYIIGGFATTTGDEDGFLLKIDNAGNVQWAKRYGNPTDQDGGYFYQQTTDGGYIIGGYTGVLASFDWNYFLIKTDANGDTLWTKKYGTANTTWEGVPWSGQQTFDGGFMICGYGSQIGGPNSNIIMVKTDSLGNSGCDEYSYPFQVTLITPVVNSVQYNIYQAGTAINTTIASTVLTPTDNVMCCHNPLELAASDTLVCSGGTVNLDATGAFTYLWSTGSTTGSIAVNPGTSTTYSVIGLDGPAQCDTLLIDVNVIASITATAGPDTTICPGDSASLWATGGHLLPMEPGYRTERP